MHIHSNIQIDTNIPIHYKKLFSLRQKAKKNKGVAVYYKKMQCFGFVLVQKILWVLCNILILTLL